MKRFVSLLLAVLMAAAVLSGCAKQPQTPETPQEEAVTIRVGGLKGPTSMGLVKLLDDAENQKTANAINFQMAASANELNPLFLKGELDIMAVPANLGSVLYNKTQGGVKMLAVSTLACCIWWKRAARPSPISRAWPERPSMPPARVPPPSMP